MDAGERDARAAAAAALLGTLDSGEDPPVAMIEEYARLERERDPVLAKVLPLAAVPRRLDAGVLAVLAGDPSALDEGWRLMDALARYSFVRPHPSGGLAYHDRVRDGLRRKWRAGDPARVSALSQQLSEQLLRSLAEARRLSYELRFAGSTLLAANPARLTIVRTAVEWRLVISLKEALYHARDVSPAAVVALLLKHMTQIEDEPRLVEIAAEEARISRDELADAAGSPDSAESADPVSLGWLRYCEARFLSAMRRDVEAETLLRQVQADAPWQLPDGERLRHWVLGSLGLCLEQQERYSEAESQYAEDIRLLAEDEADPWNLGAAHQRLAGLQIRRLDVRQGAESYHRAAAAARDAGNEPSLVIALANEADALRQLGRLGDAAHVLGEALHLSRTMPARAAGTSGATDRLDVHRFVGLTCMRLAAPVDLRTAETIVTEVDALTGSGLSERDLEARMALAELLRECGALDRARRTLDDVSQEAGSLAPDAARRVQVSLDFQAAFQDAATGDLGSALRRWDALVEQMLAQPDPSRWDLAAARSNRLDVLVRLGRLDEAAEAAAPVRATWQALDLARYCAVIDCVLADVRVRQGRLEEAESLLEAVREPLLADGLVIATDYHRVAAAAAAARGSAPDAAHHQLRRADEATRHADLPQAVRALALAAAHGAETGDWELAASCAARGSLPLQRVAAAAAGASLDADGALATSVRAAAQLFFVGRGDRITDLAAAYESYATALRAEPDNAWLHVGCYYVCVERADHTRAAKELHEIERMSPAWLAPSWVAARRQEARTSEGPGVSWPDVTSSLQRMTDRVRQLVDRRASS